MLFPLLLRSLKIIPKAVSIETLFLLGKLKHEYNISSGNFNKCVGAYATTKLSERAVVCIYVKIYMKIEITTAVSSAGN